MIRSSPRTVRSITVDYGTEFHGYRAIEERTNAEFYFATPHHSWERGTSENTNGLIRQYLPKKKTAVILINGVNLYNLIVAGMKTMEPDAELPPFKITCKTPISMGVGQSGKSAHVVMYVPTQLVKEVVGIFMVFVGGGPGAAPPVAPDDF